MSTPRAATLERIHRILKTYADVVKANVSSGRTDILIDAESTFCGLLNIIHNFDLERPQQFTRNYPAVDLIDKTNRVAVQITSTNTRQKAQHTVESFMRHGFQQQFDTLIILILAFAPAFRNADQLSKKTKDEGINLRIITLLDLAKEIESLPQSQITQIAEYLEKNIGFDDSDAQTEATPIAEPSVNIDELSDVCRQVFCLATLLPKTGLERTVFEHSLSPEQKHALIDLCDYGLLLEESTIVRIHPYYQNNVDYIPTATECAFFLDRLWNYEESLHWDKLTWRQKTQVRLVLAQIFGKAADFFPTSSEVFAQQSAELWRSTQNYQKALDLEQKALELLKSSEKDSWNVARALHFTGDCHYRLKNPNQALVDWKRTLEMCRNPLHASDTDLATAYQNVGRALIELEQHKAARDVLLKGLKIAESLRRKGRAFLSSPWMETIYASLSTVYTKLNNISYASLCTENALRPPAEQENLWEVLLPFRYSMPHELPEEWYAGRKREISEITERIKSEKVVFLSGSRGMGKTVLANQFGSTYRDGVVYYIHFRGSLYKTVMQGFAVSIDGIREYSPEEVYQEVIDRLARCHRNDILIIDDVDIDPRMLKKDPVWKDLMQIPLRLLIITHYDIPGAVQVSSMDNKSLYQIFFRQDVHLETDKMDRLIQAVNGHPVIVTLISNILKYSPDSTVDKLLSTLETDVSPVDGISDSYSHEIFTRFHILFRKSIFDENERKLLRNMALLPQTGMDTAILESTLDRENLKSMYRLIDLGWLSSDRITGHVTIVPIIRKICLYELKPDDDDCKVFLDAVWAQYNPEQYHSDRFQQYAELYSQAATYLPDTLGTWSFRAAVFWSMLGQTQEALRYELQAASRQEQSMPKSDKLATTYSNLGLTYGEMGSHQKALDYQMKALEIRRQVLSPHDPTLANSYNNIGHSYGNLGNHPKALEYILKALSICEEVYPDNHPNLALSYYNAGITYSDLGDYRKGLEYHLKALVIRQKVLPKYHPELVLSLVSVGTAYSDLGDYNLALKYQIKALEIREKTLSTDLPNLALTYNTVGSTYSNLGDHQKALDYKIKALRIQEKVLPPDHPELAATYNNIGSTYDYLGDHNKALEYTMKAMAILERTLPSDHPHLASSYNNLAATYGALGDHQKALEYHLKSMSIFETVMPPDHPDLATAYSNVGYTYGELGQYPRALEYLKTALSIYERTLPEGHPRIDSTRKGVAMYQMMVNMSNNGFSFNDPLASKFPNSSST